MPICIAVLDATGKIGAGLLRGNINQFGDYDQCTKVSTTVKTTASKSPMRVHGKYCLAQIEMRSTLSSLKEPLHLLHGRDLWHAHLKHVASQQPSKNGISSLIIEVLLVFYLVFFFSPSTLHHATTSPTGAFACRTPAPPMWCTALLRPVCVPTMTRASSSTSR